MSSRKRKRKSKKDNCEDNGKSIAEKVDLDDVLIRDHDLPHSPIEKVIAEIIDKNPFPHELHVNYCVLLTHIKDVKPEERERLKTGPFDDVEKEILSRNWEIIFHSDPVRNYWSNDEERKHVTVALLGYCIRSKFYDGPYNKQDILTNPEDNIKFKLNLGRGLPNRLLHSIYDWCRRTYNPYKNYSEEKYKGAIEYVRTLLKVDPDRKYNYNDVSNKYEVSMRGVQKIYQLELTPIGDDPFRGLYQPMEDLAIIEGLLEQTNVDSYEELRKSGIKGKWIDISKKLQCRATGQVSARWAILKERIRTNEEFESFKYVVSRYNKDICRMIYCLYREKDKYENQVDWYNLTSKRLTFSQCVSRYRYIKCNWIPHEVICKNSHRKNVKWLYKNILPDLTSLTEKKLAKLESYYQKNFFYNR